LIVAAEEIPVSAYASKLLNRAEAAEGTMAFRFEKPPGFDFKPGQSVDLTLLNPPETGRINKEMLSKYLNDLTGPIYYIAGPPAMVSGLRKMLVESGVDEDDIRTDEFAGY
jgi:ferredoxin-NADP reductase